MRKTISVQKQLILTDDDTELITSLTLDEPTKCPMCEYHIQPILNYIYSYRENKKGRLALLYICPQCSKPFLSFHWVPHINTINLDFIAPKQYVARKFSEGIEKVSPMFVKVYNESLAAESQHLNEIAGMGYRKALEFLIKDISIHKHLEEREKIESMHLGECINQYVDYPPLKITATGSAWLGNDQAHYKQKYSDMDLSDLKEFMDTSIFWVDLVLQTDSAARLLSRNK